MPCPYRIDLKKVEKALLAVQKDFALINETLIMSREPMRDEIISNMLEGYSYVNHLLEKDINPVSRRGLPRACQSGR